MLEDKIHTWLEKLQGHYSLKDLDDIQYGCVIDCLEEHVASDIGGNLDPSDVICPIVDRYISKIDTSG